MYNSNVLFYSVCFICYCIKIYIIYLIANNFILRNTKSKKCNFSFNIIFWFHFLYGVLAKSDKIIMFLKLWKKVFICSFI